MSECTTYCEGTHEGHGHITIMRPRFVRYIVRVRRIGARRFEIVCRTDSRDHAFRELAGAMASGTWKRGDILGDEGPESYYEPSILADMRRPW